MHSFVGTFKIMHEYAYLVVVWREGVPCFHVWERQKPVLVYIYIQAWLARVSGLVHKSMEVPVLEKLYKLCV